MRIGQTRRGVEAACWLFAFSCALYLGLVRREAQAAMALVPVPVPGSTSSTEDNVLGELRIPALGLAVPFVKDDDHGSLLRGVGHIPGTAMPGGLGTAGLAGHRDTFLRPLAGIRPGMDIQVSRGSLAYRYRVERTEIVRPEQVDVLAVRDTPELVLVTCYPFHYVGAAPFRFIVHAKIESIEGNPALH